MSWAEVTKINSDLSKPLNEIDILKYSSVVKSIQRGVWGPSASRNFYSNPVDINIAAVNPTKCSVRLFGSFGGYSSALVERPIVKALTATVLTIANYRDATSGSNFGYIGWEIVEYY